MMPPNDTLHRDNVDSARSHRTEEEIQSSWIHRRYLKDSRLRVTERYRRAFDRDRLQQIISHETLIVPQAHVVRKYLPLVHRLIQEGSHQQWVLLESALEYLDWTNQVGAERAVSFERQRLQSVLEDTYVLDVSWKLSKTDEWDLLRYDQMTEAERCRQAHMRAVHWLLQASPPDSSTTAPKIWIVVDDETSSKRQYNVEDASRTSYITMEGIVEALYESADEREPFMELLRQCQADFAKRNAPPALDEDFPELSESDIREGLQSGTLLRGRLNVSKDNVNEAYVSAGDVTYFIDKRCFQHAFHQDVVVIQVLPESKWGRPVGRRRLVHHRDDDNDEEAGGVFASELDPVPSARIVGIDAIGRRIFVATLLDTPNHDDNAVIVVPMDVRIPKIRIRTRSWNRFVGQRIKVQIADWEPESKYPHGQCLSVLGAIGDLETEIKALLIENQVELEPFTVPALSCLPVEGDQWRVREVDLVTRRDLRTTRRVFSVDPPGCQDIDDTMHAEILPNGDIEIGVHIADVTHFVEHNSPLDLEAQARGTTFYLVDRRFDMLPSLLSSDLCSLHGGIDRLAVSAIWVLSSDFNEVKSVWFGRTVIHNCAAMTYDQADRILRGKAPEPGDFQNPPPLTAGSSVDRALIPSLKRDLSTLTRLARFMRQNREDFGGAVDLSSGESGSELKFTLENGVPRKVAPKEDKEIHHTIAELMIMANTAVAKQIYKAFPTSALLRIHRTVEESRIEDLKEVLGAAGISLSGTDGKSLAEALKKAKDKSNNSPYQSLLLSVATRAMTEAQYISTGDQKEGADLRHYGLGLDFYTHFTSPIRRYADVIVHKQLLGSLQQESMKDSSPKVVRVDPLASVPESNVISILNGEGIPDKGGHLSTNDDDINDLVDALTAGASSLVIDDVKGKEIEDPITTIPYEAQQVSSICEGLNLHNRLAKQSSFECQALFLSLFFKEHEELVSAVVTTVRDNGFFAYIPKFDIRGPVYVRDVGGIVQMDPALLGLTKEAGNPPTAGFRPPTRSLPGATCHLSADERLEIRCDGRTAFAIKPMDVVAVRLTCDDWDVRARVPSPRLHLVQEVEQTTRKTTKQSVLQIDSDTLRPKQVSVQPKYEISAPFLEERSLFNVISDIPIRPNVPKSNFVRTESPYVCEQTIRGRCIFSGFVNPDTKSASQEAAQKAAVTARSAGTTTQTSYDAARNIEKSVTLRQQRLTAAKRNTRRSKGK